MFSFRVGLSNDCEWWSKWFQIQPSFCVTPQWLLENVSPRFVHSVTCSLISAPYPWTLTLFEAFAISRAILHINCIGLSIPMSCVMLRNVLDEKFAGDNLKLVQQLTKPTGVLQVECGAVQSPQLMLTDRSNSLPLSLTQSDCCLLP